MIALLAFILAFPIHVGYELLGRPGWAVPLLPVNESVWEHLKLAFYPVVLFMLLPITRLQQEMLFDVRIQRGALGAILSMAVILFGYYGLKEGFGVDNLGADIALLLLGDFLGCFQGFQRTEDSGSGIMTLLSVLFCAGMIAAFWWFGINPMEWGIFQIL